MLHFQIEFKVVKVHVQAATGQSKIRIAIITIECLLEGQQVKRQIENSRTTQFYYFTKWRGERFSFLHFGIKIAELMLYLKKKKREAQIKQIPTCRFPKGEK